MMDKPVLLSRPAPAQLILQGIRASVVSQGMMAPFGVARYLLRFELVDTAG